jgi:hypothetical protein
MVLMGAIGLGVGTSKVEFPATVVSKYQTPQDDGMKYFVEVKKEDGESITLDATGFGGPKEVYGVIAIGQRYVVTQSGVKLVKADRIQ